jgi:hypothetical protein
MDNINKLMDSLRNNVKIVGTDLPDAERLNVQSLAVVGLELLRQFLLDVNRCANALEALADVHRTTRSEIRKS